MCIRSGLFWQCQFDEISHLVSPWLLRTSPCLIFEHCAYVTNHQLFSVLCADYLKNYFTSNGLSKHRFR